MIKKGIRKIKTEEEYITEVYCDFCGSKFDEVTTLSNGFGQVNISFGYGSKFDDDGFNLQICDKCFIERYFSLLEKQFRERDYDVEKIKEIFAVDSK